ncbi:MAG: DNA topoisomerase I [Crenarchaeota archaeon 13_1_40CM_3_52_4]|nr:MAG: DNA topoisomerase I [Crenarchaeota archaeon 13_1_40CM_3_52_4]
MPTLIVCEKPTAAARVARALDEDSDPRKIEAQGVPVYEARNRSETILVCSALGHLYAVDSKTHASRRFYPVWDFEWKPKHLIDKKSARLARWIHVISSLANKADRFINACVSPDTRVLTNDGDIPIAELEGTWPERRVVTLSEASATPVENQVTRYHRLEPKLHGISCFELKTLAGRRIRATADHKFWSRRGWLRLENLRPGDQVAVYSAPRLDSLPAKHEPVLTIEDVWTTLNSFRYKQSRHPHSRYRYDSREHFEACNLRKENLSYPEIATRTGLSLRTVRRWLGEGRQPYTVSNPVIEKLQDLGLAPLFLDDEKLLPIARLLGATFADGCLSQCSDRWYSVCFIVACERSGGAEEVARDLEKLGFRCSRHVVTRTGRINGRSFVQKTEQVRCSSLALWLLLKTLGAPSGSKTDMALQIPGWIIDAPKRVQYEFLSTYLGGDVSIPKSTRAHPRSFNACELRFNKREDLADNGRALAVQIASILTGFGVRTTRIQVSPSQVQRLDGSRTVTVRIAFSNEKESMENLLRKVPVQYCPRKRIRGDLVAEYIALKTRLGSRRIVSFDDWASSAKEGLDNSLLQWDRIETIVPVDCDDVRDLTINPAQTYIANGFLTHNCDYDVEGSLIGYTILRYARQGADSKAQRMKFSTMTEKELQSAYKTLSPYLDIPLVEAGRARHELDWLYGINLSRLLTESALKQNRGYSTLSTGRVQGPTLKFVVDREEEIQFFTPTPFWTIDATVTQNGQEYILEYEKEKISTLVEAERVVKDCKGTILEVESSESRNIQQSPPYPFDLSNLQSEAYRHFGYTPSRTLGLAEKLYLEALISYPRTSSQKLPPDIGYSEILRGIANMSQYRSLASRLTLHTAPRPIQGPKEDSAHPAVYPTGESPKRPLIQPEANLLDLIIRRFMVAFGEASLRESSKLTFTKDPHRFFLRGSRLLKEGWIQFYRPYTSEESQKPPDLKVGDKIPFDKIQPVQKFTEPPPRYNPGSLLRKMEDENIGTKATRAEIIEILFRRGYIKNTRIEATSLALKIISLLNTYCPLIIDPAFTAKVEASMDNIQTLQTSRLRVLTETLDHLRPVMLDLISREDEIGSQLAEVATLQRIANLTFDYPCPQCGSKLKIIRSRTSGKRFIGCTGYDMGCRFTLPLPQFGNLSITQRHCKVCGFQLVQARTRGRRPMISCARCYSSKIKAIASSTALPSTASQPATNRLLEATSLVKDQ